MGSNTITYGELMRRTTALAATIQGGAEQCKRLASHIDAEAKDTARTAEQIAALKVDTATVAETREVSRIMQGLSQDSLAYANAADDAARAARFAGQQTRTDHGGIQEAVRSAPVDMPDRQWLTQE